MARTSSLNSLSCRNPYQTPHSLNPSPLFTENPFFLPKSASSDPLPKNRLLKKAHKHKEMGPQNWTLDPTPKTPLDPPPRNSLCAVFCWENQHLHKEFGRLSPLLDPPARVPPKFFMQIFFGCFFPFVICALWNVWRVFLLQIACGQLAGR